MPGPVYEMLWDCDHCDTKGLLGKSQRHCRTLPLPLIGPEIKKGRSQVPKREVPTSWNAMVSPARRWRVSSSGTRISIV